MSQSTLLGKYCKIVIIDPQYQIIHTFVRCSSKPYLYNELVQDIESLGSASVSASINFQRIYIDAHLLKEGDDVINLSLNNNPGTSNNEIRCQCRPIDVNKWEAGVKKRRQFQKNSALNAASTIRKCMIKKIKEHNSIDEVSGKFTLRKGMEESYRGLIIPMAVELKEEWIFEEELGTNNQIAGERRLFEFLVIADFLRNIFLLESEDVAMFERCDRANSRLKCMVKEINPQNVNTIDSLFDVLNLCICVGDDGSSLKSDSTHTFTESDAGSIMSFEEFRMTKDTSFDSVVPLGKRKLDEEPLQKAKRQCIQRDFPADYSVLPDELWRVCFCYLPSDDLILNVSLSCRYFYNIIQQDALWSSKQIEVVLSTKLITSELDKMLKSKKIIFRHVKIIEVNHQAHIPTEMMNLGTYLHNPWNNGVNNDEHQEQQRQEHPFYNWMTEGILAENLQSLHLSGSCSVSIEGIIRILNTFTQLDSFSVDSFRGDLSGSIMKQRNTFNESFKKQLFPNNLKALSIGIQSECLMFDFDHLYKFISSILEASPKLIEFSLCVDENHPKIKELHLERIIPYLQKCISVRLQHVQIEEYLRKTSNFNCFSQAEELYIVDLDLEESIALTLLTNIDNVKKLTMEISPSYSKDCSGMVIPPLNSITDVNITNFVHCGNILDACGNSLRKLSIKNTVVAPSLTEKFYKFSNLYSFSFSALRIESEDPILQIVMPSAQVLEHLHFSLNTLTRKVVNFLTKLGRLRKVSLSFSDAQCNWLNQFTLSNLKEQIEDLTLEVKNFDHDFIGRDEPVYGTNFHNLRSVRFVATKECSSYNQVLCNSPSIQRLTISGQALTTHRWFGIINGSNLQNLTCLRISRNVIIPLSEKPSFVKILYQLPQVKEFEVIDDDGISPCNYGMHLNFYCNLAAALPNLIRTRGVFPNANEIAKIVENIDWKKSIDKLLIKIFNSFLMPSEMSDFMSVEEICNSIKSQYRCEGWDPNYMGDEECIVEFCKDLELRVKLKQKLPILAVRLKSDLEKQFLQTYSIPVYSDQSKLICCQDMELQHSTSLSLDGVLERITNKMKIDEEKYISQSQLKSTNKSQSISKRVMSLNTTQTGGMMDRFAWMNDTFFPKTSSEEQDEMHY